MISRMSAHSYVILYYTILSPGTSTLLETDEEDNNKHHYLL